MSLKEKTERLTRLPVGVLATTLGAATLSNVYSTLGFNLIRNIFMLLGFCVIALFLTKIVFHKEVFKKEFSSSIPAGIYGTFAMVTMILGSFIFQYNEVLGRNIIYLGIFLHTILIVVFTYLHLIKNFVYSGFVPTWYIPYNGIMVSVVVGGKIIDPLLAKVITYYGIVAFLILTPLLVKRILKEQLPHETMHSQTIFMAPLSLCLISYLTVEAKPNLFFASLMYIGILGIILIILSNFKRFFSVSFNPGFAALTFPMAIATVASLRMSGYLKVLEMVGISNFVRDIMSIQMYITTALVGFVIFNFYRKV